VEIENIGFYGELRLAGH